MVAALPDARGRHSFPEALCAETLLPSPGLRATGVQVAHLGLAPSSRCPRALRCAPLRVQDSSAAARGQHTQAVRSPAHLRALLHWVESFPLLFCPLSVWEAGFPVTTTMRHPEELARCVSRHAWVTGGENKGNVRTNILSFMCQG